MTLYASQGSSGDTVRHLQTMLNYLGATQAPLVVDGIFGPKTRARVVQFQQQAKLSPDGIVGPNTGKALVSAVVSSLH